MDTRIAALAASMLLGLGCLAAPAAADGSARARPDPYAYNPEPVALYYDWSGIYIGGHAGVATAGVDWTFTNPTERFDQRATGFAGGAQIGLQKQWHYIVIGAEVSYTWTDLSETSGSLLAPGTSRTSEVNNLLLATGRLGFVWQNLLAYWKGGYATADVGLRSSITGTGVETTSSSAREQGWVAGLGIDYGLTPNISIGVEYDYIHFNIGTRDQVPTAVGLAGSQTNGGIDLQTVMARLNFRFGSRAESAPYK
jgi:outer membrane immunogenic protein